MAATKQLSPEQKKKAFLSTARKNTSAWKEARNSEPGEGQSTKLEDGRYEVVVTGEVEVAQRGKLKGKPVCRLIATVQNSGEKTFDGETARQQYNLHDSQSLGYLVGDLKRFFPDRADEITGTDEGEFPGLVCELVEALNDNPPVFWATITVSDDRKYANPRFEEPFDGEEAKADSKKDKVKPDNNDDPPPDDEGDATDEGSTDESGSDDEGEYEPQRDDPVSFRDKGRTKKGTVVTVNRSKKTCTIKSDATGNKWPDIAWDRLSYEGE